MSHIEALLPMGAAMDDAAFDERRTVVAAFRDITEGHESLALSIQEILAWH